MYNFTDSSELINDLASRIRTVPSSTMDLCREAVLQKEKFIYDCLSKINGISQSNFENIRNELKETLTSYDNEGQCCSYGFLHFSANVNLKQNSKFVQILLLLSFPKTIKFTNHICIFSPLKHSRF